MLNIKFETKDPEIKKELESIFDDCLEKSKTDIGFLLSFTEKKPETVALRFASGTSRHIVEVLQRSSSEVVAIITDLEL